MVCDGMENNCSAVARSGQRMVAACLFLNKVYSFSVVFFNT